MTINHAERISSLFIGNQLDQFLQAIELLYPQGAFIRTGLHPEGSRYCRVDDATRRRPGFSVRICGTSDADIEHLQVSYGREISGRPYVTGE